MTDRLRRTSGCWVDGVQEYEGDLGGGPVTMQGAAVHAIRQQLTGLRGGGGQVGDGMGEGKEAGLAGM